MNSLHEKAFALRMKGYSYNEIHAQLGIPKSTLSSWFTGLVLGKKAKERIDSRMSIASSVLIERNKRQTFIAAKRVKSVSAAAQLEVPTLTSDDLLIVGAVMYWAEGYKRVKKKAGRALINHPVSFVNSDADMVAVFIRFLKESLKVPEEKIVLTMRLYKHINESAARNHWSKVTGLPASQFRCTTWLVSISSKGKRPFNILPHGTLQVAVNSTDTFYRLMGMIEGVKKQLAYGILAAT